ncbi:hypothetical protein NECID01_0729 [Nematocida sp. AWRm77]|nr:hypothetical protein NECID01_0729 [Nematocida sp. AWRm77]
MLRYSMTKIAPNMFLLIWAHALLVCSADFSSLDFELTDELEMMCAYINPDNFYSDYSDILDFLPRDNVQKVLQEEQALKNSCALEVPEPSNTVNSVVVNNSSSVPASLSLPSTSPASGTSSAQVQSPAGSSKRACDTAEKEDREEKARKRQKTETTTLMAAEANSALMNEAEVYMAVEKFRRYFGEHTKFVSCMQQGALELAKDLAQRGLISTYSRKIMELCTASEKWLGHNVFWKMLMFFVDMISLEVVELNQLENKKTVVLRNRTNKKPLSECTDRNICRTVVKCRGTEQMEMQCSLNVLEDRGTTDMLGVLRWLLYHVKIECVGITCDLTEEGMSSVVFGRQVGTLTKEWRGSRVRIDSLALHFRLAQYKEAAVVVKECPRILMLKIHFINDSMYRVGDRKQALEALLLHYPALEQLSVSGLCISIEHIQTIAAMLPQLELLEVEFLNLERPELDLKKEKKLMPVLPNLKTLKLPSIYKYLDALIKNLAYIFPNLKFVQISAMYVMPFLINALSKLPHLQSLEIINGLLLIEIVEYLLEKLPSLKCLSVGVYKLDNKLAHTLSKYTSMHTLNLRGQYTPGFLASLLQPSPLMCTLKVLCIWRNSGSCYTKGTLSAEDLSSKKAAMKKFGCAVELRH